MKRVITATIVFFVYVTNGHAQLLTKTTPEFSSAIQKIYFDFPNNFKNIEGTLVLDEAEYEKYASTISLPGTTEPLITRYHSVADTTASWQALVSENESFEKVAKQYADMCHQLQKARIRLVDGTILYLNGAYNPPSESSAFTTSAYFLPTSDPRFSNVRVEVEIVSMLTYYKVLVSVFSKKPDDQGSTE
jgi:hypothetical protein